VELLWAAAHQRESGGGGGQTSISRVPLGEGRENEKGEGKGKRPLTLSCPRRKEEEKKRNCPSRPVQMARKKRSLKKGGGARTAPAFLSKICGDPSEGEGKKRSTFPPSTSTFLPRSTEERLREKEVTRTRGRKKRFVWSFSVPSPSLLFEKGKKGSASSRRLCCVVRTTRQKGESGPRRRFPLHCAGLTRRSQKGEKESPGTPTSLLEARARRIRGEKRKGKEGYFHQPPLNPVEMGKKVKEKKKERDRPQFTSRASSRSLRGKKTQEKRREKRGRRGPAAPCVLFTPADTLALKNEHPRKKKREGRRKKGDRMKASGCACHFLFTLPLFAE